MAHASDDHKDTPEVDSSASMKERKNSRLTPMPDYLMHWWTPVLFAFILLVAGCFLASIWRMPLRPVSWQKINPYWPPSWPFNYHWPSKDAMTLCATIAGAGFAFSAWQQRSHDNAIREEEQTKAQQQFEQELRDREQDRLDKQHQFDVEREERERNRLEQIERDEYWKRREQIYQILGSKNPGLRLGAVALLAELADSAAHSTLLNKNAEQQLQRHIIDTLCLQIRHEGIANDDEGTKLERAEVQQAIIEIILSRINSRTHNNIIANWSQETINLNNSIMLTKVSIHDIDSKAKLNLENSEFKHEFNITNSNLGVLAWENATFPGGINIGTPNKTVTINTKSIPQHVNFAKYINTIFITEDDKYELAITEDTTNKSWAAEIKLQRCSFWGKRCACSDNCECKVDATGNDCRCRITKQALRI